MASSGSGYDLSSSTFSPDGRIFQVEYASKAVENAGTLLGMKCTDGIVLAVEKPLPQRMLLPSSSRRIHTIDTHSGIAITGFVSDGRQVVSRAWDECPPRLIRHRNKGGVSSHGGTIGKLFPIFCS